jgi:hypothetical protein
MAESFVRGDVLKRHDTEVLMYESHLKDLEGRFFALTKNNQVFNYEDVCVSAGERGDYRGSIEEMKANLAAFFKEAVWLLRDGYRINMGGLVELYINLGGNFETPASPIDPEKNPASLNIRRLHDATLLAKSIRFVNLGPAPFPARIDEIIDSKTGAVNELVTPGRPFTLTGTSIKIAGTSKASDRIGISFLSPGSPDISIGVTENLILNERSKIIGITPDLLDGKKWKVVIRTKHTNSGLLKETREIISSFTVQKAPASRDPSADQQTTPPLPSGDPSAV